MPAQHNYIRTTDTYAELKRSRPHGKLTQNCCTGNSIYRTDRPVPKRIPQSVERKLVRSVERNGFDVAATKYDNRLQAISGGKSNVGMRSSLACASSSSKTSRFIATNVDIDTDIDNPTTLSLPMHCIVSHSVKGKRSRKLGQSIRAIRHG